MTIDDIDLENATRAAVLTMLGFIVGYFFVILSIYTAEHYMRSRYVTAKFYRMIRDVEKGSLVGDPLFHHPVDVVPTSSPWSVASQPQEAPVSQSR
jgi:hypothetical protein